MVRTIVVSMGLVGSVIQLLGSIIAFALGGGTSMVDVEKNSEESQVQSALIQFFFRRGAITLVLSLIGFTGSIVVLVEPMVGGLLMLSSGLVGLRSSKMSISYGFPLLCLSGLLALASSRSSTSRSRR